MCKDLGFIFLPSSPEKGQLYNLFVWSLQTFLWLYKSNKNYRDSVDSKTNLNFHPFQWDKNELQSIWMHCSEKNNIVIFPVIRGPLFCSVLKSAPVQEGHTGAGAVNKVLKTNYNIGPAISILLIFSRLQEQVLKPKTKDRGVPCTFSLFSNILASLFLPQLHLFISSLLWMVEPWESQWSTADEGDPLQAGFSHNSFFCVDVTSRFIRPRCNTTKWFSGVGIFTSWGNRSSLFFGRIHKPSSSSGHSDH